MIFMPAPRFTTVTGLRLVEVVQGSITAGGASTITMPSNRDDVLVVAFTAAAEDSTNSAPSIAGFTTVASSTGSGELRIRLSYAFGPGATANVTTNSTTRNVAYIIYSFLGPEPAEAPAAELRKEALSAPGPDPYVITPTVDGSEILIFGAVANTTTTTGWAAPAGYSDLLVQSAGDSSAENVVIMSARMTQETAAAEDPGVFTPTTTVHDSWKSATVVVKPAT